MRLNELFNDDLYVEHKLQNIYIDCVGLINAFNSMSDDERLGEMIDIWKSWEDGDGKAKFLQLAGMSMQRAHSILSTSSARINFEDYVRFKSVGKDYAVITQKYNLDEQTKSMLGRYRRIQKGKKEV